MTTAGRLLRTFVAGAVLAGCGFFSSGDGGTQAVVNGETYDVVILHPADLHVSEDDLTEVGEMEIRGDSALFADDTAYALEGVDSRGFLLASTAPGQGDDAGPYADYLGLLGPGDSVPAVCAFVSSLEGC